MRILHVTPHLPPDQAANALLPAQLGDWARARGDEVAYLAHPPRSGGVPPRAAVTWVPRPASARLLRWSRAGSIRSAWRIRRAAVPLLARADVVHVHSNGLLAETVAWLAASRGIPLVLTLYGTEIWHYRPRRPGPDLFTRAYRRADAVTFYSERLLARARELGLDRQGVDVVYPPVAAAFTYHDVSAQQAARRALGVGDAHLLVNVKRLHPLAGQEFLLEALPAVRRDHPDVRLVICGTGPLLGELQEQARAAGVAPHVTFAGLVDNATVAQYCAAADLFVLPSRLEALPTVAVEALASGTPVVSSDNPGGVELQRCFGDDVEVVPRENAGALADAIRAFLRHPRRTRPATAQTIASRFRPETVAAEYWRIYERVRAGVRA